MEEKVKCLGFGCLIKTSLGNVNSSFTEGNVMTLKKVTLPDGSALPYVSGQAIRRMIRDRMSEMGERLSELHVVEATGKRAEKSPDFTEGDPEKYIDDDLLGYLNAEKEKTRRRTAPVRVSPAIGLFPYAGDRDLGTKSKERSTGDPEAGGAMFETEITYNIYRMNILVELDRLGVFQPYELQKGEKGEPIILPEAERKRRLGVLVRAIFGLWGGGKQTRLLTDFSPQLIIYTQQLRKTPLLLERFMMTEKGELNLQPIKEALSGTGGTIRTIQNAICGIASGFLPESNEKMFRELMQSLNIDIYAVQETEEKVLDILRGLSLPP